MHNDIDSQITCIIWFDDSSLLTFFEVLTNNFDIKF